MVEDVRIILTGFMGVGKSTVAKHLASMLGCDRLDLDAEIVDRERKSVAGIIEEHGIDEFRRIESEVLAHVLGNGARVIALGGGAWTIPANRELIKSRNFSSIWLETGFDHCWLNIVNSKRIRPLARNKSEALRLFEERRKVYCLADWHFVIKSGFNSYDVARQIAEDVFSMRFD
jgi:shikimate kinase